MSEDNLKDQFQNLPEELRKQFEEDAKENLQHVQDTFLRITTMGMRYQVNNCDIGNRGLEFKAIILRELPVNLWYKDRFDPGAPVRPNCWSLEGLKPDPTSQLIQSESCLTCRWNRFGSGIGADGKRRGKACRNTRRLVLKSEDFDLPLVLSLPPTSKKVFNNYLKSLSSGTVSIPLFIVCTIFSFDLNVNYPRPVMKTDGVIFPLMYEELKILRMSPQIEDILKAFGTREEYGEGGEDDEIPF